MDLQPTLINQLIIVRPLIEADFEELYRVASDPLIWEQHPNPDRYKKSVFENYFKHALESKGAFLIQDMETLELIGCSRFYNLNKNEHSIFIGYTFFKRSHWGGKYNYSLKALMLEHAFQSLEKVLFHIGKNNIRSQKSIEKIGAFKVKELEVAYAGEPPKINIEYCINNMEWPLLKNNLITLLSNYK